MKPVKQREETIFLDCIEIPPEGREAFIENACQGDDDLRKEVLSLVRSHDETGGFLDSLREDASSLEDWDRYLGEAFSVERTPQSEEAGQWWRGKSVWFVSVAVLITLTTVGSLHWLSERKPIIEIQELRLPGGSSVSAEIAASLNEGLHRRLSDDRQIAVVRTGEASKTADEGLFGDPQSGRYSLEIDAHQVGERYRFHFYVTDLKDKRTVWAETLNRGISGNNLKIVIEDLLYRVYSGITDYFGYERPGVAESPISYHAEALELFEAGKLALDNRNHSRAIEAVKRIERAVELDPNFAMAHLYLAQAYLSGNGLAQLDLSGEERRRRAWEALEWAKSIGPDMPEVALVEGRLASMDGDKFEAKAHYQRAVDRDPEFAEGYYALAELGWEDPPSLMDPGLEGFVEEMLALEERAARLEPVNPKYHWAMAHSLEKLGRWDQSFAKLNYALELNPEFVEGYRCLGYHNIRNLVRYDLAIPALRRAIALDPSRVDVMDFLRDAYESLGDIERAAFWTETAMAASEEMNRVLEGDRKRYAGDPAGAILAYRSILGDCCETAINTDARRRLFNEDMRIGNVESARDRYYKYVTKLFSEKPVVDDWAHAVFGGELAAIFMALGEIGRAERLLSEIGDLLEGFPLGRDREFHEAVILTLRGDSDGALALLEAGVETGAFTRLDLEDARLDSLRGTAAFARVMDRFEAKMKTQRESIQRLEQNGEIPPIPRELFSTNEGPTSS